MAKTEENSSKKKVQEEQNGQKGQKEKAAKAEKTARTDKNEKDGKAANDEKVKALEEKVASLEESLAKEKDDYMRLRAEFETFRRRSAEDRLELVKSASANTIKGMLPVLDDLERAMEMLSKSEDEAAKEGTALIYDKLMAYLGSCGLEPIEAKGEKFNTDFHEAVTLFPTPDEDLKGCVVDVLQTGYTLNGKVIRFAKVVVGA